MKNYIKISLLLLAIFFVSCNNKNKTMQTTDYYDKNEFVPRWAKSAIWYQIFVERFRDGDSTNNPTVNDIVGADPLEPPKQWQIHPWGSDWYELQPYEKANGEPELWKHLLRRRYGGDLQGVIDKLDYLKDLGINAIYLNPVFDSPSLHKYDGNCYHHIDPNFGPDPEGDRKLMKTENPLDTTTWVWTKADELVLELIEKAHSKGIRIIFDGVFNHMGINSFAFQDVLKNQEKSPYKDWFIIKSWEDKSKNQKFEYEGWFGVKSLPELNEDENGIIKSASDYIFNSTQKWMNPKGKGIAYGIDGWRLDVAFCVSHQFWKKWRKHVRSINPEAYLTAEIIDKPEKTIPYMQGDEFDGEMNYNFAFASAEFFFNPDSTRINVSEYDKKLKYLRELYPQGVAYVCQNLFGSHDSNRLGSHIVNAGIGNFTNWGEYFNKSLAANNSDYDVSKPKAEDIKLQKLFVIMQMTYVGAPMIYYGDEIGMWGANDPDCRKPMIWNDIKYQDEVYKPDQTKRSPDKVEINQNLKEHYKKLIAIRNNNLALQLGSFETILCDDINDVYVFERSYENQKIYVVLNNSNSSNEITFSLTENGNYKDLLNDKNYNTENKTIKISLSEKWGAILRFEN